MVSEASIALRAPAVEIRGHSLAVRFERFDATEYATFLRAKRIPEQRVIFDDTTDGYVIEVPARFAGLLGVAVDRPTADLLPLPAFLFDDQAAIVRMALDVKRFACWSDCGHGKTLDGLEFARQVVHLSGGGRVLIVTLNEVVPQWLSEAAKFYGNGLPLVRLGTREEMREWCGAGTVGGKPAPVIAVTNYEKFNHGSDADQVVNEVRQLSGIILDESSRLKTGGGKQKWALIKSARGVEYKLSLTATPAPNEIMEFASQASFLEKMRSQEEIIWTFFRRDEKTHRWTVKPHALKAFFEFMSGWSIYVRDPRKYGWRMNVESPPEPEYLSYAIPLTPEQRGMVMDYNADPANVPEASAGMMFAGQLSATAANKLSQAAKGFVYLKGPGKAADTEGAGAVEGSAESAGGETAAAEEAWPAKKARPVRRPAREVKVIPSLKPKFVADLIAGEASHGSGRGLQILVWTVFDEEARILSLLLQGSTFTVETLNGRTPAAERAAIIARFQAGETRVLIGRADMLGFGLNFQRAGSMVFSGWTFSYEAFYQAVRRAYRHGQTRRVRVHVPVIPELEGQMWDAIVRKQGQHEQAIAEMEANYVKARQDLLRETERVA